MKLHKVDDENKPLKGIEFTLYKDADGNLTFDNLEFGDYHLAETKGDAAWNMKNEIKNKKFPKLES